MGIHGLKPFLKDKNVNCFFEVPLNCFWGKRIAIDTLNWYFCYQTTAVKNIVNSQRDPLKPIPQDEIYEKLVKEFIRFNLKLMNHGVTPVWIWDGVSKDNKGVTKVERRNARQKMRERRDTIIEALKDMSPLEMPYELVKELKQLTVNTAGLKREKLEQLKELGEELGLPTIVADDEAEALAASLAVERIVAAVWSADTDTYVIGCPIVVKNFAYKNGEVYIEATYTLKILLDLKLSHAEFRDFCILLGTDFNDRIHGIGPKKAYKLIEQFRNLETVEKETKHNCYGLKYRDVREQLSAYDTKYTGIDDLRVDTSIDFDAIQEKYQKYDLVNFFSQIRTLVKPENIIKKNLK